MNTKILPKLRRVAVALPALLLSGCTLDVLDPRGPVGLINRNVMLLEAAIMLLIVIPVIALTIWFAYKYRASNTEAEYLPRWHHSNKIEAFVWGFPAVIVLLLGAISAWSSYAVDPYRPLKAVDASGQPVAPLNVQVVSLDWKWLFIYPDQGIATINQLAIPVNTPINFRITSDAVMNSFFIPRLGSQVYAMAGMQTQVHLLASKAGNYAGESANYSGRGFSDMKFRTLAMSSSDFQDWVEKVKQSANTLDSADYPKVAAPQEAAPVEYFSHVQPGLFDGIVAKYNNGTVIDKSTGKVIHVQSAMSDTQMKD